MWWAEHAAMGVVFSALAIYLAWRRNWFWLSAAALSQVPFWAGLLAFMATGESAPSSVNLIFNVMVAGCFAALAERLQGAGRGGIVQIWLCFIFLGMASMDVIELVAPFGFYVSAQEASHYLALLVIGGRAYVHRIDGSHRRRVHPHHIDASEDLA